MFEWDLEKADSNFEKHRVLFEEASTVFFDEKALDGPDIVHSNIEPRYLRLGKSLQGQLPLIAYTLRRGEHGTTKIRIISARQASRKESKAYSK